jgi:hypothetical protein
MQKKLAKNTDFDFAQKARFFRFCICQGLPQKQTCVRRTEAGAASVGALACC